MQTPSPEVIKAWFTTCFPAVVVQLEGQAVHQKQRQVKLQRGIKENQVCSFMPTARGVFALAVITHEDTKSWVCTDRAFVSGNVNHGLAFRGPTALLERDESCLPKGWQAEGSALQIISYLSLSHAKGPTGLGGSTQILTLQGNECLQGQVLETRPQNTSVSSPESLFEAIL